MEAILASVILPAAIDMFKGLFSSATRKFVGLSVDDQVKLQTAEVSKLEALAKLDNPNGNPSQWVVDLRASFRYIAAGTIIAVGSFLMFVHNETAATLGYELVGMPFGFIFGERLYLGLKGAPK
jgi:hypothetical protein